MIFISYRFGAYNICFSFMSARRYTLQYRFNSFTAFFFLGIEININTHVSFLQANNQLTIISIEEAENIPVILSIMPPSEMKFSFPPLFIYRYM